MAFGFGPGGGQPPAGFEEFLYFLNGPGARLVQDANTRRRHETQHARASTAQEGITIVSGIWQI